MMQSKGQPLDDKAKADLTEEVSSAVEACLAKPYSSKEDAIDAIIADLEALKGGPEMGGLGDEEGMDLGKPEGESEEEGE